MSTKPKFDPSQVANLLNRGAAEARGAGRPLVSVPPSEALAAAPALPATAAESSSVDDAQMDQSAVSPVAESNRGKRAITVRLSDEVLSALYRHQADVRCVPGSRLKDTTIGGVIDTLLREPLRLRLPPQ